MDLILILVGAVVAGGCFLGGSGSGVAAFFGLLGLALLMYGLVLNHRRHQFGKSRSKAERSANSAAVHDKPDPVARMAALEKFKQNGVIDESQYEQKKTEILRDL